MVGEAIEWSAGGFLTSLQSPSHHMSEVQLYALAFLVSAVTAGASITTEGRCNFNVLDEVQAHSHTKRADLFDRLLTMRLQGKRLLDNITLPLPRYPCR